MIVYRRRRFLCKLALLALVMTTVAWIRLLPLEREEATLQYRGEDGQTHVYLGDFDSYLWLRMARNVLQSGTPCDAIVAGECRDNHAHAPVGARMLYGRSLHVAAIAWVHRCIRYFEPSYPLPASAFLVAVIIGALGVLPAFAIGWRLAGLVGAIAAALLSGLHPLLLQRSIGGDNDVWNVVLPLYLMWAVIEALLARSTARAAMLAAIGGLIAALHADIWSGWQLTFSVACGGVLAAVGRRVLLSVRRRLVPWRDSATGRAVLVGALLVASTVAWLALRGTLGSPEDTLTGLPDRLLSTANIVAPAPQPEAPATVFWPDNFTTVGELTPPRWLGVKLNVGTLLLGSGWLGAFILILPRRRWRWWHWIVFGVGTACVGYALYSVRLERAALTQLMVAPIVAAWVLSVFDKRDADGSGNDADIGLLLVAWQIAALWPAHGALRFTMIAVPPLALGAAVAIGRVHAVVDRWLERSTMQWRNVCRAAVFAVVVAIACIEPLRRGAAVARDYTPAIDSAWWDTLTAIRDRTPPETVINTFWIYGYWSEFVADRRVIADGASLNTHLPYWLARVFYTGDEREAVGLLRMLDCGSDTTSRDEVKRGAFAKLIAHGVDPAYAPALIHELARQDAAGARKVLAARSLPEPAIADILESTHCVPPPAVLVLSTELGRMPAWQYLGGWDFAATDVLWRLHSLPTAEAIDTLTRRYELSAEQAHDLLQRADRMPQPSYSPQLFEYVTTEWAECTPQSDGRGFLCPIGQKLRRYGFDLAAVVVRSDAPAESRLRVEFRANGKLRQIDAQPAMVLMAGESDIETTRFPPPWSIEFGILFDAVHHRVLVGTPAILQSTFTQLMYLDGRYSKGFQKMQEHIGHNEDRVVTWRVDWDGG